MASRSSAPAWFAFGQIVRCTRAAPFPPPPSILSHGHRIARPRIPLGAAFRLAHSDATRHVKGAARTAPDSLRKVAVEAQRSSSRNPSFIRGTGRLRHVDPDADTKDVTAYCAAETYDLHRARKHFLRKGYVADPFGTGLFPQVLHLRPRTDGDDTSHRVGDVFIFPSGCVVTWDIPNALATRIVESDLPGCAGQPFPRERQEVEDLEYIEDPSHESSRIIGDTIILGTSPSTTAHESPATAPRDTVLAKIAFSSALARSVNLAVLESRLAAYFLTTRTIPATLSSGKPLRVTRSQILRKTGELLHIRARLNLYSELTDSLPDVFWDSPHSLGLEGYYEQAGKALDVGIRIRVLNEKMDYASEIAAVLRERLSEKHSSMLEWMIIGLICIEVGFGIVHLARESGEMSENDRLRTLVERYLERELSETPVNGSAMTHGRATPGD